MRIAILLYEDLTSLDAIGPYEVLSRLPGAEVVFVGKQRGFVRAEGGALGLGVERSLEEVDSADIVLVPGGRGACPLLEDVEMLAWLRAIDATTRWTTSVCTGSLILAAAGLLDGRRATCHWIWREYLRVYDVEAVEERVVVDGKYVTAAGVSAGIDMALELVRMQAGEDFAKAIQLSIEYAPDPPFDTGSPATAPEELVEVVREIARSDPGLRLEGRIGRHPKPSIERP